MQAYIYRAALLCEECGQAAQRSIQQAVGQNWKNVLRVDSDVYPQGPYPNGGGEADSPQHCDHCGTFLENPLTDEGRAYVKGLVQAARQDGTAIDLTATGELWVEFYELG